MKSDLQFPNTEFQDLSFHITASESFPRMEELVISASRIVRMCFHVFSSATLCRSEKAKACGLSTWSDIICDRLSNGVTVQLLVNDFDAVGAPELHRKVALRTLHLAKRIDRLPIEARQRFQLHLVQPGGRAGGLLQVACWPWVRIAAKKVIKNTMQKDKILSPGLQKLVDPKGRLRWWPPKPLMTQSVHQKFIIADDRAAILGGLDVDERRFDDPTHQRLAPETWHDVNIAIEGETVLPLVQHFVDTWNICVEDGRHIGLGHQDEGLDVAHHAPQKLPSPDQGAATKHAEDAKSVTILRTVARHSRSPFVFGPTPKVQELQDAHCRIIREARELLYIETQFLRSSAIRDALTTAAHDNPSLSVIMLLPGAPEVVAFNGNKSAVHRYGEWLQSRALDHIRAAYGPRFGAFCLTNELYRNEKIERDALHNKNMVYIHSKVILADDEVGIVSSANLNGRSMAWDFEVGAEFRDPYAARELKEKLWSAHLPNLNSNWLRSLCGKEALDVWKDQAQHRKAMGSLAPGCGVVPYPHKAARLFSKRHLFLPEEMV